MIIVNIHPLSRKRGRVREGEMLLTVVQNPLSPSPSPACGGGE